MSRLLFIYLPIFIMAHQGCSNNKNLDDSSPEEEVNTAGLNPVNPLTHGFNVESLYYHYHGESDAQELITALGPKVFRFPGGTPANIYHFSEPGYGYSESEAQGLERGSGPYKNCTKSIRLDKQEKSKRNVNQNYAHDFSDMCKQLGAQVLLVANLLGDDENNLEMIRHFKSKGVEIAGIELGNEIYLDSYRPSFPTPASYVARARRAAEHIRKEFPELKIGIVAAGSAEIKKLSMKQKFFFSQWNDKIAAEDFYDAFITHIYSKNAQCDQLKSHEKFECYLKQNSVFTEQAKQAINGMSTLFKGKKAWVTEWNMKDKDQVIGNTGLQAMFYADFQLMLASQENVEIATYHNLLTGGSNYNMIARDKNRPSSSAPSHVARATHPIGKLLSFLYTGEYSISTENPADLNESMVTLRAYSSRGDNGYILINKSPAKLSFAGLGLDIKKSASYEAVIGSGLQGSIFTEISSNGPVKSNSELRFEPWSVYKISLKQ